MTGEAVYFAAEKGQSHCVSVDSVDTGKGIQGYVDGVPVILGLEDSFTCNIILVF